MPTTTLPTSSALCRNAPVSITTPTLIIAHTVKGRGLHFEDRLESHDLPLSEAQYAAARLALEQDGAR